MIYPSTSGALVLRLARVAGAASLLVLANGAVAQSDELDSDNKKFSYFMGLQAGNQLKQRGMAGAIDPEALRLGVQDALDGNESRVSTAEVQEISQKIQAMMAAEQGKVADANTEKANAFFAKNKTADGIQTTESGIQYKVVNAGDGTKPAAAQQVKVHYRGTLLDDSEFDSSYRRGEPAVFGVSQVIPGWQEALQLMSVGAKWEVWIPPALAYGAKGSPPAIGPNEALHFTIELLEIVGG